MKLDRTLWLAGVAVVALAAPATAKAADTSDAALTADAAADDPKDGPTEDIIVTAQKRSQTLIDVPLSVSVVSGDTLEHLQATNFQDYLKLVPGLQLNQGTTGFGRLILRGVNTGGVASTVGVYVDDTPFGSSSSLANGAILAGDFDTFDVARVEVLRGPQGTLYGASSLGGVLKFVTNAPQMDRVVVRARAGIEAVKGGDASYYGNAVVNLPLAGNLAFRASGTYRRDGGFIDSTGVTTTDLFGNSFTTRTAKNVSGSRTYGGRAALLYQASPDFSVQLSAIIQNIENDAPSVIDTDPATMRPLYGDYVRSVFSANDSRIRYRVYNGLVNWDFGGVTLTSSTSYATLTQNFHTDLTYNLSGYLSLVLGAPNELYLQQTTRVRKFTQELRLSSSGDGPIEWLVGGYYNNEKGLIDQRYVPVTPGTMTEITSFPLLAVAKLSSNYEEIAGFGNLTVHLGPSVSIDLGGRYSHNDQSATQSQDGALAGGAATYPAAKSSDDVFTYSVAPKFKFSDRGSVYLRVARGFRPGGPNVLPPSPPAGTPSSFDSDTLTSYEAGIKFETDDRSFALDLAAFHIYWDRIQIYAVINGFGLNVNGTSAKSDGLEFTATFRPAPGFDLAINGAYTDARLNGDTDPLLVSGVKGDPLPYTPKYSIGVNGDYRWALGGSAEAFLGGSLRFLSKQKGAFDPDYKAAYGHQSNIPSYAVVDLRAGLDFGKFTVEVYAKNLNNALGITSVNSLTANGLPLLPNGAVGTGVIRPRTVGINLTAGF